MNITKEQLLQRIKDSLLYEKKPIECPFRYLRFAFGFKRVPGEVVLFALALQPSRTEEDLSYPPNHVIIENIHKWSAEHGFSCHYDHFSDSFTWDRVLYKNEQF